MVIAKRLMQQPYRDKIYQVFESEGYAMYQCWMSPQFPDKMMNYLLGMKNTQAKEEVAATEAAKKKAERPKL